MEKLSVREIANFLPNIHSTLLVNNRTPILFGAATCQAETIFPSLPSNGVYSCGKLPDNEM